MIIEQNLNPEVSVHQAKPLIAASQNYEDGKGVEEATGDEFFIWSGQEKLDKM